MTLRERGGEPSYNVTTAVHPPPTCERRSELNAQRQRNTLYTQHRHRPRHLPRLLTIHSHCSCGYAQHSTGPELPRIAAQLGFAASMVLGIYECSIALHPPPWHITQCMRAVGTQLTLLTCLVFSVVHSLASDSPWCLDDGSSAEYHNEVDTCPVDWGCGTTEHLHALINGHTHEMRL